MKLKSARPTLKTALNELHGASSRERLLHRLHSVVLVLSGLSASEAGRIYGDSPRAVAYWVTRFKRRGLDGLREEARPGRPSTLNASQRRSLQTFIKRSAAAGKRLNAEHLSVYLLKEHGISLTLRQCWRILKKLQT